MVGASILLIKFPKPSLTRQQALTVELEPPRTVAPQVAEDTEIAEAPPAATQTPSTSIASASRVEDSVVEELPVDWHAAIPAAIADIQVGPEKAAVFNRALAEKRRAAAEQFAPIPRHEPVPVWENVERDQMGRSVLHHGDCQRVINDPNVGSREAFETFGQYIVTCANYKRPPQKLAWVDEVNARRAGLSRYGHPPAE